MGYTLRVKVSLFLISGFLSLSGCTYVDCGTVKEISGVLQTSDGTAVEGWVGASERERETCQIYCSISDREKIGDPSETRSGLVHTGEDGSFKLRNGSGISWGYSLLFGVIPLGSTTPPEVAPVKCLYLYIHDESGWHTVRVDVTAEQQARSEPGRRWIDVGVVNVR